MAAIVSIVFRTLCNDKGRLSPDSIWYFRQARLLPEIELNSFPMLYPMAIKSISLWGIPEFWASKILGLLCFGFLLAFAHAKKFYFNELLALSCLLSFSSLFSISMSEAMLLCLELVLLYQIKNAFEGQKLKPISLGVLLILMYQTRYNSLFFAVILGGFALLHFRKKFAKPLAIALLMFGLIYIVYQTYVLPYYNPNYFVERWEPGNKSWLLMLQELPLGILMAFHPLIHIAPPQAGMAAYGIYAIGFANILLMVAIFYRKYKALGFSLYEQFCLYLCVGGILLSFIVQRVYAINPLDFRLLIPFTLPIWLMYFRYLHAYLRKIKPYFKRYLLLNLGISAAFIYLTKADALGNRNKAYAYLKQEGYLDKKLKFYVPNDDPLPASKLAELLGSFNPMIEPTGLAKDTLNAQTLSSYKVEQKLKLSKNARQ
jgi:hypothetical protein